MTRTPNAYNKTLAEMMIDLWRAKIFILAGLVAALIGAGAFLASAKPYYKAEMIVSPANPMSGADLSSAVGEDNLFALRYLMQRVGISNSSNFLRFENTFAGASVARILIKDPRIVRGVQADQAFAFSAAPDITSPEALAYYIERHVRLMPVDASALRALSYQHPDKDFATYFLQQLHRTTDDLIRTQIQQQTTQRIAYLQEAIRVTNNPEHRRAMTTLLLEQERLRMLVSIENAYAASVIEPPAAGVRQSWPSVPLTLIGFMFAGAFLGFLVWGVRHAGAASSMRSAENPRARKWDHVMRKAAKNTNHHYTAHDAAE